MDQVTLNVPDISCDHCKMSIEGAVNQLSGIESAEVDIAGRTGLVKEDYDQVVTVTPKFTSSLPGAPLKLLEKLFRTDMDRVFAFQYTVTGSWDDPDVERVTIEVEPPG